MFTPYVSARAGRFGWMMQRVSAVLLLVLAFSHFFVQHFTPSAVSTGLTVAARMNSQLFQAYYVVFISLAMFHGINGLVGIINDYCPKQLWRNMITLVLWSACAFFVALAIVNVTSAPSLASVKAWYADEGFPAGSSAGNPPFISRDYDFTEEMRELHLLGYYLDHHTHRTDQASLSEVFASDHAPDTGLALAQHGGQAFEEWARAQIATGAPPRSALDRHFVFSSSYEFAVWALNVRRANAQHRQDQTVAKRLADIPPYTPALN